MIPRMNSETSAAKRIFWLASYPKSGNTWFRIFLSNLLKNGQEPVSINELSTGQIGSSRSWLDNTVGFDSADMYQQEIDALRPQIYDWTAAHATEYGYHKIHDACWQLDSGEWLISPKATEGALYFVRNPLDVAISFANHSQSSIDIAIKRMAETNHCFSKNKHRSLKTQTEQRLLTWSEHVISWVDSPVITTHVMRYEDMKYQPQQTFTEAVDFLQLPSEPERINKALHFSDFKAIQQQEIEGRFREKPSNTKSFFRKGIAGDWQNTLNTQQIDQVINDHHEIMCRFGYLDEAGNPRVM